MDRVQVGFLLQLLLFLDLHSLVMPMSLIINRLVSYSRTGSGEMARVACTHVAKGWIGGVLYSRVTRTHSCLEDPRVGWYM